MVLILHLTKIRSSGRSIRRLLRPKQAGMAQARPMKTQSLWKKNWILKWRLDRQDPHIHRGGGQKRESPPQPPPAHSSFHFPHFSTPGRPVVPSFVRIFGNERKLRQRWRKMLCIWGERRAQTHIVRPGESVRRGRGRAALFLIFWFWFFFWRRRLKAKVFVLALAQLLIQSRQTHRRRD